MIQLKDENGNLMYPKGLIKNILSEPIQANNSAGSYKDIILTEDYSKYDIIACRLSIGSNGAEGIWCFIFPKLGGSLQTQFYMNIYDTNYKFSGRVTLNSNNKINYGIQYQSGWSYNSIWLNKVIGIKIT